jgi:peptidoglycan/LPS O-acetylase OafA/YrhL
MSIAFLEKNDGVRSVANSNTRIAQRNSSQRYRPDIDGLRAIAVLSVVAFHFNIGPVPGGFIGVDIFFVISGFLITGNIVDRLDGGTFSFLDFYQRRIRRIFPALLAVLSFTLAVGTLALNYPDDLFLVSGGSVFEQMYRSVAVGAAFLTNFTSMYGDDYFTQNAVTQPLLHLWSLAVEEQFYILWPLFLSVAAVFRLRYFTLALAIAAVSFATNVLTVSAEPLTAFYSLQTRAWELMLGAALTCAPEIGERRFIPTADVRSVIGILAIAIGLFAISRHVEFPGWAALLPTVGAVLIISAGPDALLNRSLLSAKGMVWIGLISYPLYLWHWPALRLFEQLSDESALRPILKAIAVIGSVAASWLTYRFIEVPFRFGKWRTALYACILLLVLAGLGMVAEAVPILAQRSLPQNQRVMLADLKQSTEHDLATMFGNRPCFRGHQNETFKLFIRNGCLDLTFPGKESVFLIGDSHSAALAQGLRPLLAKSRINFIQVSTGWCKPTDNNESDKDCKDINNMVAKRISELRPELVIIDAWWMQASGAPHYMGDDYFAYLRDWLINLKQRGARRIIVIGQIPVWSPSLPDFLSRTFVRNNQAIPERTFSGVDPESLRMDAKMRSIDYPPGVTYLSMKDTLCNDAGCLTLIGPDVKNDLVVWDHSHLTLAGSEYVTRSLIEPALADILSQK